MAIMGVGRTFFSELDIEIYLIPPASRLVRSGRLVPGDLIRLNAWSRTGDLSAELEPHSLTAETAEMQDAVARARVLVTTAATAGSLARHAAPAQFSHLLLDEAGQLTEPESLVAAGLLDPSGLAVLAGDPHQLGPVLVSRTAQLYGLAVSLLERLTKSPLYLQDWSLHPTTGGFHSGLVVKLVANYRSHPDIIAVSNNLFYCGELEARASQTKQYRFTGPDWELGGATGPLVFRPVSGESEQEPGSRSWQNRAQAWEVARLTCHLLARGVRPEQIGVIAAYTGQAARVREMVGSLTGSGPGLRVGSVEEWQGQERPVIILTTVRSSSEGSRASLGFLACQKRFNVAVTRAQSLLVVVGDPALLITEPCWRQFLRHVVQQGGFTGDTEIPEELLGSGSVLNL